MKSTMIKYGLNRLTATEEAAIQIDSSIPWNQFNYPPVIKLFRYSQKQIPEQYQIQVFCLWFNHILILAATLFNIVTNICATVSGYKNAWMQIIISIFLFIIWAPCSIYIFYLPYLILIKREGSRIAYYLISVGVFIWFFIWSIANFADANGFVRVSQYFMKGFRTVGFFAFLESLMCLGVATLSVVNAIWINKS